MKISISMILVFVALANSAIISDRIFEEVIEEEWESFKLKHTKSYDLLQDGFRRKIFMENKHRIAQHNTLYHQNKTSYKMKINKYGDLLEHEFTGKEIIEMKFNNCGVSETTVLQLHAWYLMENLQKNIMSSIFLIFRIDEWVPKRFKK